jgi:Mrp family chromosome partitioning ATPase
MTTGELDAGPGAAPRTAPRRAARVNRFDLASGIRATTQDSDPWLTKLVDRVREGVGDARSCLWLGARPGTPVAETALVLAIGLGHAGTPHQALLEWSPGTPALGRLVGVDARVGADDVVAGRASVDESLVYASHERLAVVPLARGRISREGKTRERLYDLIGSLEKSFDLVHVIGSPLPLAEGDVDLAARVGAVILVTRMGEARALKSAPAFDRLNKAGAHMRGLVLADTLRPGTRGGRAS